MARIPIKMSCTNKKIFVDKDKKPFSTEHGYTFSTENDDDLALFERELASLHNDIYCKLQYEVIYSYCEPLEKLFPFIWINNDADAFFVKGYLWHHERFHYTD